NVGFQPYLKDVYVRKLAGAAKFAAMNTISEQDAQDRKLFGPVYHGTTEERQEQIGNEGFKVYIGDAGSGDVAHGYEGNQPYHEGIPAPVHHLGYGIYFTTAKSIAKQFAGGTTRGMKTYYLDVPRLETINFGVPKTMMKWWVSQGYNGELAKKDRVEATKQLTEHLKSQFDAVWFKGKGLHRLLDGDQICVFDPSRVYQVDKSLAKPGDVGSKVKRLADGMKGTIVNVRSIPEDVAKQYWGGETRVYQVKWTKGGTDHNVRGSQIEFIGAPKAQGATASKKAAFFCVACDCGGCIEHDGMPKQAREGFNEEGFWAGEGNAASGVLPICTTTQRICLAWRSPDVHIGDCWGTIGGACKPKMSLAESAKAELTEETGFDGSITMQPAYVFQSGEFSYHNFLGTVGTEFRFAPQSEHHWETTGLEWFTWGEIQQMMKEDPSEFHPGLISLFKSSGKKIEQLLGKPKTASGDNGDMPNPLQVFPERPDVIETFRHMRPFERDRLIEEAPIEMVNPADLKTNQRTVTKKTVKWFVDNPEEIRKPRSNIGLSDTEQLYPLVCRTSEGDWLYDGNHRSAAALWLKMEIEAKIVDLTDYEEPRGKVSRKVEKEYTAPHYASSKTASDGLDLGAQLKAIAPQLAIAAQKVYDQWDASDETYGDPEVGFGGICHVIVDAMADVVSRNIPNASVSSFSHDMGEVHVSLSVWIEPAENPEEDDMDERVELFDVDIPPYTYETGGGYNWKKIPDVTFDASDIVFYRQLISKEDLAALSN